MVTVGLGLTVFGRAVFAGVVAFGIWAIRRHDRMFPQGFDRTGWSPVRERVGWLMTKFTWLSGGRSWQARTLATRRPDRRTSRSA